MKSRVCLIHWNLEEGQERQRQLVNLGYLVDYVQITNQELRGIRDAPPDSIVIDLSRAPSQGRDMGLYFRKYATTRHVPLVFVDGRTDKVDRVRESLPDAVFTRWENIEPDLTYAITNPLKDPVVPDSLMAGYSGTPLPKKLGIKANSDVLLIYAPEDFEDTLGILPDGVHVHRDEANSAEVTLWFVYSQAGLHRDLERFSALYGAGRLWIAWPKKSSGIKSDLTQAIVRQAGLNIGLVDYKIAAIDEIWSGLCFTRRKK